MSLIAITRPVGPLLGQCELTFLKREEIDICKATQQHASYEAVLRSLGVTICHLPERPELPDAVFVEDTAFVTGNTAIMGMLGAPSRRPESSDIEEIISKYRHVIKLDLPAMIDGGDVLQVDRTVFIGLSKRTNHEAVQQIRELGLASGYSVQPVDVRYCLHLKTACARIGPRLLLANSEWIDNCSFVDMEIVPVDPSEAMGSNALLIGDVVVYPNCFPRTAERLRNRGIRLQLVDISELQKAEAGVTCLSVLFDTDAVGCCLDSNGNLSVVEDGK